MMKTPPLPERDRRDGEDIYNIRQRENRNAWIDRAVVTALGAAGIASFLTEGGICYRVFSEWFAPDVPGDPARGSALLMSMSTLLSAAAFHVYLTEHPDARAGKLLDKCVPWLVLAFVGSMALMAAHTVLDVSGIPFFGGAAPPDLLSDSNAAPGKPFFERLAVGAFGFGLAGLAISNFWLTQRIANLLWGRIKGMTESRAAAQETQTIMDAINADEERLHELDAERQKWTRELEPKASWTFANKLAALVQELRGPVVGVITGWHVWKKPPESVVERHDDPELAIEKYEELAQALDLTPQRIYAAFRGDDEGKKKS